MTAVSTPAKDAPQGSSVRHRARAGRGPRSTSTSLAPLLFISVAVVLFLLFFVWPGALAVIYSFTDYRGVGDADFVGLDNYVELAGDSDFYAALSRTVLYTALAV